VLAVLQTRPQEVVSVRLGSRRPGRAWGDVADAARGQGVPVSVAQKENRSRRKSDRHGDGRRGASSATVREQGDVSLEELFAGVDAQEPAGGCYVALDCLQDPHNVGAVFRTSAFFGVRGIVLTKDRSAPLNGTVYDVASGGIEFVPFSLQTNLSRTLEFAQQAGLWTLGTSEHAETDFHEIPRDRPWLLVLGNEEKGLRRLTAERCDMLCRITPQSPVSSLNVSVAAGILIAHFSQAK